jgi:hypothetical protein
MKRAIIEALLVSTLIFIVFGLAGQSDYDNAVQSQQVDLPHWDGSK